MIKFGFHTEGAEVASVNGEQANGKTSMFATNFYKLLIRAIVLIIGAGEKGLGAAISLAHA
jgi:hypothetical protein